jgi:large subunit ribosomal protein L31
VKANIHPTWYPEARVTCACGNSWTTGSTIPAISTDVCSNCHPFYTGEQRIVDTEGQVDRFMKRLRAREDRIQAVETATVRRSAMDLPIAELELGARSERSLEDAGVTSVGQLVDALNEGGDEALLSIKGFGHKGLIDLKRKLRARGYNIPVGEE